MRIAYLVNRYPHPSHTFIRREVQALPSAIQVERFSLRPADGSLPESRDREEAALTRVVLECGAVRLATAWLRCFLATPWRFLRAMLEAVRMGARSRPGIFRHVAYLAEASVLLPWVREAGCEHLHAHFGTNSATVALLCRTLGGPPFSFTVHGPEEFDRAEPLHLAEKTRRAAFVVAISHFGRSQLLRWTHYDDWDRIHVVRCGLDRSFLERAPQPPSAAARLVCVGRLCEQKGQVLLLQAVHQLLADGVEVELELAGDGPLRTVLEEMIHELGLAGAVKVLGWCDQATVTDAILHSRALVLPSFAEGLPVVLMEAFALHRPVLSTYVAGIPELVEPGVSGWLVPAGSLPDLVAAMREVLAASPERLFEMGRAGSARVRAQHCAATEAARLGELFFRSSVAAEQPGAARLPQRI